MPSARLLSAAKWTSAAAVVRALMQVLQLVLEGKLSKEIAGILGISQNTIENHRSNLFRKFGVTNLAELFRQASRLGFWQG